MHLGTMVEMWNHQKAMNYTVRAVHYVNDFQEVLAYVLEAGSLYVYLHSQTRGTI